jgi:cytochrome P450
MDPPKHTEMRKLFTDRIGPRHLKDVEQTIHARAKELVQHLLQCRNFDGVTDVAHDLPLNVIFDLIGWPEEVRGELLGFAIGSFNSCGPEAPRMQAALPRMEAMMAFITKTYDENRLTPGGFGDTVADAARRGEIPREAAITLLAGYIVAAFDTTINAIGNGLWLFAEHPEQWQLLRQDPGRVPTAFLEILRIESPLQHLARVTTREVDLGDGVVLPAGARVVLSYASANRDERHYPDPERFDIERNPLDHLAFGLGTHTCAGQGLARLEGLAVFSALAQEVDGFTLTEPTQRDPNSVTRGFSHLPMRIQ